MLYSMQTNTNPDQDDNSEQNPEINENPEVNAESEIAIRAPDPVIRERLIDGPDITNDEFTNYNYNYNSNYNNYYVNNLAPEDLDTEFNRILQESKEEFEFLQEKKVKELIVVEKNKMIEKYHIIKQKLQKIQSYDTVNANTYSTIITIIEMYEMQYIETYSLDETSYNNIFNLVKTIRLTKEEYELLNALIIC
jgi:DNA-directed RNA polymerase subunit H (RpoH/RPB5)